LQLEKWTIGQIDQQLFICRQGLNTKTTGKRKEEAMKKAICAWLGFCFAFGLFFNSSIASTIAEGEVRTAKGVVSSIDEKHGAIVVKASTAVGELTVGVTLLKSVQPTKDGQKVNLSEIVGKRALLKYTREDDRLVGLAINILE